TSSDLADGIVGHPSYAWEEILAPLEKHQHLSEAHSDDSV
ncbi:MAG: hypothetical protein QG666_712, partial [Euryarchaeota archaeon]|nr:hypothetical protein [Euryarchaeota archaeon]